MTLFLIFPKHSIDTTDDTDLDQPYPLTNKTLTFPQQDWKCDSDFYLYELQSHPKVCTQLEVSNSEIETFLLGLYSKPEQHIPNTKQVENKGRERSPKGFDDIR